MLKHKPFKSEAPTTSLLKHAHTESADAARARRARSSNPYPVTRDMTLRREWFHGYDQRLAELARNV